MRLILIALLVPAFISAFSTDFVDESDVSSQLQTYEDDVGGPVCRPNGQPSTIGCCYAKTFKFALFIKVRFFACISMRALPRHNTARLIYALNHQHVYAATVSLRTPKIEECKKIPGFPKWLTGSEICLVIRNVNYRRRRVCASIHGSFHILGKRYTVVHNWGCFKLPEPTEYGLDKDAESDYQLSSDDLELDPALIQTDDLDLEMASRDLGDDDLDLDGYYDVEDNDDGFSFDE